ncbi:MAG: glycosyltransferase [Ktedonobacterales bacterium]|nr:glycosyltransferase [Ktedonobacterales bacterium]
MRIMLFSDTYAPQINGVATSVRTLSRALAEHGHEVAVCAIAGGVPAGGEHAGEHATDTDPFPVFRVRGIRLPRYPDLSVAAPVGRSLLTAVAAFHPDLLHFHTPFGVGWRGMRAAHTLDIPRIGTHHTLFGAYVSAYSKLGNEVNQRLATLARRYVASFYNQCDVISCASRFLARDLASGGMRRPVMIVSNPVDTARFRPRPHQSGAERRGGQPRLIFFGRLAAEKNLPTLISLVAPVLRRHTHATLDIVGDGPMRPSLEALVRQWGLEGQVRFTGFLCGEALARRVARSDVGVCASLTENQPMALLESLACGVPVVALAAAGVPEIIEDGVNGYLVAPDGAAGAFAERIERLLTDGAARRAMACHARESAQRSTRAACLAATMRAYEATREAAAARGRAGDPRGRWHMKSAGQAARAGKERGDVARLRS